MFRFAVLQTSARLGAVAQHVACCQLRGDPDAVHDLRVATRRLEGCLRTFQDFFPRRGVRGTLKRLATIRDAAGGVRDRDIALELASKAGLRENRLTAMLSSQREQAAAELAALLDHRPLTGFIVSWARLLRLDRTAPSNKSRRGRWRLDRSPTENCSAVLPDLAERFFDRAAKLVVAGADETALHRLRIRAKRLRYALELFPDCYGRGFEKRVASLKGLQEHLGSINDCRATATLLSRQEFREGDTAEQATALTHFLEERLNCEQTAFLKLWEKRFKAPGRRRRWSRYFARPKQLRAAA